MSATVRVRDLTSREVHELPGDTPVEICIGDGTCESYPIDSKASGCRLGGFKVGDVVYVRSTDPDTERPGRVLWWASEVL